MATHPSILASEIPWTEDLGRLYSPQGCKESETSEAASTHAQIYITQTSSLVLRTLHWVAQPQGWHNLPESLSPSPRAGCTLPTGSQCQASSTRVQSLAMKGQFTGQSHLPSWGGGPAGARGSGREREWGAGFSSDPWQQRSPVWGWQD